jgi:hypothetical protein
MTDWMESARKRARAKALEVFRRSRAQDAGDNLAAELAWIASENWIAGRPSRYYMASLWEIARYWSERTPAEFSFEPLPWPHCFACNQDVPCLEEDSIPDRWNKAGVYLVRAHLVDRELGGLDGPQNLVPLCQKCHRGMLSFRGYDEYPGPAEWVRRGGPLFDFLCFPASGGSLEAACRRRQFGGPLCTVPCSEDNAAEDALPWRLRFAEDGADGLRE